MKIDNKRFRREITQVQFSKTNHKSGSDVGRARPSQAEGQGKAETLSPSPKSRAELNVLYFGRAERPSQAEQGRARPKVRAELI